MKTREARRNALVKGRIRLGASWQDVSILNISSRGLLLHAASPPERGIYVEVCRGLHTIVARVAWSKGQRFGVRTQDRLSIDDLLEEPTPGAVKFRKTAEADPFVERRSRRRQLSPDDVHERNRLVSRVLEFVCFGIFAAFAGTIAFSAVGEGFARPLSKVLAAL